MRAKGRQAGFTLIEILIALVVLVVGIVGIVAIFPVGIANTADATGDTIAANLAESVHAALVAAHRNVVIPPTPPGGVAPPATVVLIHDLHPGNRGTGRYAYELPSTPRTPADLDSEIREIAGRRSPYCHPDATQETEIFALANDPYIGETTRSIRLESDPTEPYSFYGFQFFVRKVPTVPVGGNSGLYEYTIYVYRIPGRGPLQAETPGPPDARSRCAKDAPPDTVIIPRDGNGTPLVPYWILTARIGGP